jgi:hypothetical protein
VFLRVFLAFLSPTLGVSQTVADLNAAFSRGDLEEVVRLADSMLDRTPKDTRL